MADLSLPQVDETARTRAARALTDALGDALGRRVRFGRHDRMLYATDASIYQVEPIGVVVPRSVDELLVVIRTCHELGLAALPRGGGTSLAGQCVNQAVVIDTSVHLDRVLEVDVGLRTARVEPGVVLDQLNATLAEHGLMFGPDVATSSHACLGGMIGNNSAGARSVLYGRTAEHLRGLRVALVDGTVLELDEGAAQRNARVREITARIVSIVEPVAGEIDRRFPKITRHVDGYNLDLVLAQLRASTPGTFDRVNLASLLCGSEGTLAVTLESELGLVPVPAARGLGIVAFPDVDAALRALTSILAAGPSAVELVDDVVLGLAARNVECRRFLPRMPEPARSGRGAVLYVEHFGDDEAAVGERLARLAESFGEERVVRHVDSRAMAEAWALRKAGEPLLHGMPGPRKPITFIEDLAVDPAVLADFVAEFRDLVRRHGTTAAYYAHASVGCLHIRPLIDLDDPEDRRTMQAIASEATGLVMRYGGALSGEHGDGRLRSGLLERFYGAELVTAMRRIKAVFDPDDRLNPGNIVAPEPMTTHLRNSPHELPRPVPPVDTFYRYGPEHGFAGAVTLCNGAGVCRRMHGGTMCPSYRATRNERHATRGRGNALRLAITGQLGDGEDPAWNDPETLATLDLCLSCKACKSECPSNVDLARLKAEYLAQSHRAAGGAPLRTRLFGDVHRLSRAASVLAPLSGRLAAWGPARRLTARVLGLDPRRTLPPIERSLHRWFRRRAKTLLPSDAPAVVLLADCFSAFGEPRIGRAAVTLLEMLGYRVVLPDAGCCGRAMISNGLLDRAIRTCTRTAERLAEAVARERPVAIVSVEPSCASAIADDWIDLKLGVAQDITARLADLTLPVEHFVERAWSVHPRRPDLMPRTDGPPVLLHGHCHQKALWDLDEPARLLARLVGPRLVAPETGCCGMAGAFGFTREHFDMSMGIAELGLLPAIRAAGPDAMIVAAGTSCRHQVRDATGREAVHPVELLAAAIRRQPPASRDGGGSTAACSRGRAPGA